MQELFLRFFSPRTLGVDRGEVVAHAVTVASGSSIGGRHGGAGGIVVVVVVLGGSGLGGGGSLCVSVYV